MFSGSVHVVASVRASLLFMAEGCSRVWRDRGTALKIAPRVNNQQRNAINVSEIEVTLEVGLYEPDTVSEASAH